MFGQFAAPPVIATALYYAILATGVAGAVFAFTRAIKVNGTGMGILFGILCFAPCIGLISLLVVNAKATSVLKQNGIKVGLLGTKLSDGQ